jgi:hypothetical protein
MRTRLLAAAAVVLAVAGCTQETPPPVPVPTDTVSSEVTLVADLMPRTSSVVTAAEAEVEAIRLANAVQALIEPATILGVDEKAELVPADDDIPAYYGIARAIALDPAVNPTELGGALAAILAQSGWTISQATDDAGVYQSILTGGAAEASWVLFVEGNGSVAGASTLTITLGSPDIVE